MDVLINRTDSTPLYRQIASQLEEKILRGELGSGMKLPTERYLASILRVHRSTVTTAYDELRSNGLIMSKTGSGNFVRDELWNFAPGFANWQAYIKSGSLRPSLPLLQKVRELSQHPSYINFADGELAPELLPNELLQRLLREQPLHRWLGYSNHLGEPYLRETLTAHLHKQYGITTSPEQLLVTSGSQQSLHLITQSLLSYGDCIGIEGPSYFYALPLFLSAGIRFIRIPSDEEGILPEAIPDLHKQHRIKMLFLTPTYHNPTASSLPASRRLRLLEICRSLKIPIVEDDVYGAIHLEGADRPPPPISALDQADKIALYLGSLSKTTASGIRLGWIAGAAPVIERLADAKQQLDFGTSTLLQQVADALLSTDAWEEHLNFVRRELTRNRDVMLESLDRYWGDAADWNVPQGGYHVWCRVKKEIDDMELLEKAIRNEVIYIPGRVYGADHGYIRLSYSRVPRDRIVEGVKRLGHLLGH